MASGRSIEQACRHLLRNLDDAHALAENELVAPLFRRDDSPRTAREDARQALASVRRLLRAAAGDLLAREGGPAEAHALRQHVILTRCDLMGEPHKLVAASCGLSMRQFYRERSAMIARLAGLLTNRLGASGAEPACTVDVTALELARARALQYSGYGDCAQVVLHSIADASENPATVVAAGCQLVSLLLERQQFDLSRRQLADLEAYVTRRGGGDPSGLERERIALEQRNLLWYCGEELEARKLDELATPALRNLAHSGYRPAQEFAAQALLFSARRLFAAGFFQRAWEAAEEADSALYAPEQAPLDVRIGLLTFTGVLLSIARGQRAPTSATFLDATSLAVRNGLTELAVLAVLALSIDDQMRGDAPLARSRVKEVEPLAVSIASPLNLGQVYLRLAHLALEAGQVDEARLTARRAEETILEGSLLWTSLELVNAHVSLASGDFHTGRVLAERVAATAEAQQNDRAGGEALHVLARCLAGLNARSGAIEIVESAIEKLERCGDPLALAAAYRWAADLTGRARYSRAAGEVAKSLQPA